MDATRLPHSHEEQSMSEANSLSLRRLTVDTLLVVLDLVVKGYLGVAFVGVYLLKAFVDLFEPRSDLLEGLELMAQARDER
jgi:hypothetical protein